MIASRSDLDPTWLIAPPSTSAVLLTNLAQQLSLVEHHGTLWICQMLCIAHLTSNAMIACVIMTHQCADLQAALN